MKKLIPAAFSVMLSLALALLAASPLSYGQGPIIAPIFFGGGGPTGSSYGMSFNGANQGGCSASTTAPCASNTEAIPMPGCSVVCTGTTISWAFWLYWNGTPSNDYHVVAESSDIESTHAGAWIVAYEVPNAHWYWQAYISGSYSTCYISPPTLNAWHYYVLTMSIASTTPVCTAYIDGSSQSITASGSSIGVFQSYYVSLMARAAGNGGLQTNGYMSEFAIWTSILSSTDAANLYNGGAGVAANTVESGSILAYDHLCGIGGYDTDVVGAWYWTYSNSPTQIAGPGYKNCT